VLFSLHHVIDLEWMKAAYRLTRKGWCDGHRRSTAADYKANCGQSSDLLDRINPAATGPAVRRHVHPQG